MGKHTVSDLYQMQSPPLSAKVQMTERRIREWVEYYGIDGSVVSFSGGKDSTLLLHIARKMFPDIPAVFLDTGVEYPEVREFVKRFENGRDTQAENEFPPGDREIRLSIYRERSGWLCIWCKKIYGKAVKTGTGARPGVQQRQNPKPQLYGRPGMHRPQAG